MNAKWNHCLRLDNSSLLNYAILWLKSASNLWLQICIPTYGLGNSDCVIGDVIIVLVLTNINLFKIRSLLYLFLSGDPLISINILYQVTSGTRSWLYESWIYNYLCNQYLSPLKLWVWTLFDTTICETLCYWLATGWWFSPVSSTNKTDCHDITEILLMKVVLNSINQPTLSFKFRISLLLQWTAVVFMVKYFVEFTSHWLLIGHLKHDLWHDLIQGVNVR